MKRLFLASTAFLCLSGIALGQINISSGLLTARCGADVLREASLKLGVDSFDAVECLSLLSDKNKGMNSLYEIKSAAEASGLHAKAVRLKIGELRNIPKNVQAVANITGNRHFCLIEGAGEGTVSVYIPGINFNRPTMSLPEFSEYWDGALLLIGRQKIKTGRLKYKEVSDNELKQIFGGRSCGNTSGKQETYTGSGGDGRTSTGNGSGREQDSSTKEPVIIRNGNLFLENTDISVHSRGLPLELTRYYNAQVVSEVQGWLPEPGAGSWSIENGEYSGQGDRATSDFKAADFTLELDMQTIQPGGYYSWETAWVNFRYTESAADPRKAYNCYYFLIHTDGRIELSKWKAGRQYFLFNKATAHRPTNKNRVRIAAVGENIKVYINGALEINYTDPEPVISVGRIALESYYCHSHFDNVTISSGQQAYRYDFNVDDNDFIFGYGWSNSYSLKIKEYSNHVTLYRENNSKEIYAPKGDGTYAPVPSSIRSKLTKDASGFSLKSEHGIHHRFDLSGRLLYIEDRNANRVILGYSNIAGKYLLSSITEPAGRKISLQYGANNMVSQAQDPAGNYLHYLYDAANHLIKAVDRNGNTTNYAYDPVTHNLNTLTDPEGNIYRYNYIYNDRVNDQADPLGNKTTFDYLWSTVHVINKKGYIYKYNFDARGFLQSISDPQNRMERTVNDVAGNSLHYYDKRGNHTAFAYDSAGNRTLVTDALNQAVKTDYEPDFNFPKAVTDAKGNVAQFSYDPKGNLLQAVNPEGGALTYTYNSYGQPETVKDAKGNVTQFFYDAYDNLSSKTDALGNVTGYSYDISGRITKITDPMGNTTEYIYDNNGNVLSIKDPLGNITSNTYTKNENISSVTDALGNKTNYVYDCFGNLLSESDALGNAVAYTYDTADQMHLNKADLLSVTDPNGNKTAYTYDSMNRLVKSTDVQGSYYQLGYDSCGNLIRRADASLKSTSYQYDALNRLYRVSYPDSTFISYAFDGNGNIVQTQDSTGINTFSYDKVNRLTGRAYPDGTRIDYAYDLNGNKSSLEASGAGKALYDYDNLGRPWRVTFPEGKIAQFTYDKSSRRTQLSYPNGASAAYLYDKAGRLLQVVNKNKSGQEVSKFIYSYDNLSRRTKVTAVSGSSSYTYDKISRLLSESGSVNSAAFSNAFTYDKAGNRLTENQNGSLINYTYNNLNQLTRNQGSAQKAIQVRGTVFDANAPTVKVNSIAAVISAGQFSADNILLAPGINVIKAESQDAAGNVSAHQVTVNFNAPNPAVAYAYDKNGNLTQRIVGVTAESFIYDFEGRLKSYSSPSQNSAYAHNGQGERVSKTVNGVNTKYYYDFGEIALEKTGASIILYIHGPQVDEIISDSRGYCYQYDGLGSVATVTDSAGNKVSGYDYKAFGELRSQSGAIVNPWLYTGRQLDIESGLYFYRNRYYDPRVGRFTSSDPIGIAGGINLYAYVENNPVNITDPLGLSGYLVIHSESGNNRISSFLFGNHSWIEYRPDNSNNIKTYGTWGHNQGGPRGFRMNTPAEIGRLKYGVSRIEYLSDAQETKMYTMIDLYSKKGAAAWSFWSACASFASNIWYSATGKNLQDRHLWGIGYSDPNVLAESIKRENKKDGSYKK